MNNMRRARLATGLLAAVALAGCGSSSKPASSSSTTTGVAGTTQPVTTQTSSTQPIATLPAGDISRAILLPAKVSPVSDECHLPVTRAEDGNVDPLLCAGGGVNIVAWARYAHGHVGSLPTTASKTMALGRDANATSVVAAMCSDYAAVYGTNPLTISGEKLAAAYYGWTFTDTKISHFDHASCSATPVS
jgi:hypothetical protein